MWHRKKAVNVISLILIAIFLIITVVIVKVTILTQQRADEKNLLTFTASTPGAFRDEEFYIEVAVKKPETPISGVYFTLTYPKEKMELVSIDDWNSPFDLQNEEITGTGIIKYGRDATQPLIGDQKVVTFKFKTSKPVDLREFSVAGDASIVTPDLKNIISQRPAVTYVESTKSKTESFFDLLYLIITDFPNMAFK